MAQNLVDEEKLKDLVKATILEVLKERKDLIHDLVEDALEEIGLARAIEEGASTEKASREEVFRILADNRER